MSKKELWARSCRLLGEGKFQKGWPKHDFIPSGASINRGSQEFISTATFDKPVWDGSKKEIRLLVNAEFGYGDTIQFVRYCPQAATLVHKLILRCDPDLHELFAPLGFELADSQQELPECDEIIHLMALPGVLNAEIPSGESYLKTNPRTRPSFLELVNVMAFTKMGMCWAGNQFNPRDAQRSIPRQQLEILRVREGITYFSLQKQFEPPEWFFDCRELMANWNTTSQIINELELVITVDTAIAHLAGALGCRQVWLLLPKNPDPRWGLEGKRTPWYKNMRIFRQTTEGDWETVLKEVGELLLNS